MTNTPQQINPTVNFAAKSVVKIIRNIFFVGLGLNGLVFLLFGAVFSLGSFGAVSYSDEAQGRVTGISRSVTDGTEYCTFNYEFSKDNTTYVGRTSVGTPSSCAYSIGSTINVKYDPSKPTNNTADDSMSVYFGIGFMAIGVLSLLGIVVGIIVSAYLSKREDRDNDGLANDGMPATEAQISLIQNGMRDLGEFWIPRKMNQAEARETINSIQLKLAEQGKTLTPR